MSQRAVGFFNHIAHALLSWTSIPSELLKVVAVADSFSLHHLRTLPYPPLINIISQAPDQPAS